MKNNNDVLWMNDLFKYHQSYCLYYKMACNTYVFLN